MELYLSELYQIGVGTITVGVFSTPAKAIAAGEAAMANLAGTIPHMLDWDHDGAVHNYFFDGFTLAITAATLDKVI